MGYRIWGAQIFFYTREEVLQYPQTIGIPPNLTEELGNVEQYLHEFEIKYKIEKVPLSAKESRWDHLKFLTKTYSVKIKTFCEQSQRKSTFKYYLAPLV